MTEEGKHSFCSHGKFFDNEQDFFKHERDWPNLPVDIEEFKFQLYSRVKEVELNKELRNGEYTNRDAYILLRMATEWVD